MQIPTSLQSSRQAQSQQNTAGHLLTTLKTYKYPDHHPAILEMIDIQKNFGQFKALDHINLDLKAGEFVSFLGPSGCGKTTLLRIIAGLENQDYGKIVKKGVDISLENAEKRGCGIVFQNYALFPNLTVEENIAFGLDKKIWNKVQRAERIQFLLDLISLPDIAKKYPNQLSGGQQQRVALARAIAPKPDLLLLDEPLSALDAQVRLNLRQKIRSIQTQFNLATIMVTHDQEEALSISDRVVVMNHGIIEQIDTPHNIYYKPQSKFVAQFIGTMNFLDAISHDSHQLTVFENTTIKVSASNVQMGQKYTVGFRPEAVEILSEKPQENDQFLLLPIQVISSEFLGAKRRIFSKLDLENSASTEILQIEIDQQNIQFLQDKMWIKVATNMLHVFDEQGHALC